MGAHHVEDLALGARDGRAEGDGEGERRGGGEQFVQDAERGRLLQGGGALGVVQTPPPPATMQVPEARS